MSMAVEYRSDSGSEDYMVEYIKALCRWLCKSIVHYHTFKVDCNCIFESYIMNWYSCIWHKDITT